MFSQDVLHRVAFTHFFSSFSVAFIFVNDIIFYQRGDSSEKNTDSFILSFNGAYACFFLFCSAFYVKVLKRTV
jgi:hypothetical protein